MIIYILLFSLITHIKASSCQDVEGTISKSEEGEIACDTLNIFEDMCDVTLSDVGAEAPSGASYDDSTTFAKLCPVTLKYVCNTCASNCGNKKDDWEHCPDLNYEKYCGTHEHLCAKSCCEFNQGCTHRSCTSCVSATDVDTGRRTCDWYDGMCEQFPPNVNLKHLTVDSKSSCPSNENEVGFYVNTPPPWHTLVTPQPSRPDGEENEVGILITPQPWRPDGQGQWKWGVVHTGTGPVYCGAKFCSSAARSCREARLVLEVDKDSGDLSGCPRGWKTSSGYACRGKNGWGTSQYLRECTRDPAYEERSRQEENKIWNGREALQQESNVGGRVHSYSYSGHAELEQKLADEESCEDVQGTISISEEGRSTCDTINIDEDMCDLPLSDYGATAPLGASYDDSATLAKLCPETLKYICRTCALNLSNCRNLEDDWEHCPDLNYEKYCGTHEHLCRKSCCEFNENLELKVADEALPECTCPLYQQGSYTGAEMCQFGDNCALASKFGDSCPPNAVNCVLTDVITTTEASIVDVCSGDIGGDIFETGEQDIPFVAQEGVEYTFSTCYTTFDTILYIEDENGNEIEKSDDHDGECAEGSNDEGSYANDEGSYIRTDSLTAGVKYILRIEAYDKLNGGDIFIIKAVCKGACESKDGVDLAPTEWDGFGYTNFQQCKIKAAEAGVPYFAWTGDVYQPGFCKVLKPSVTNPNLDTNQGYGYKLWRTECSDDEGLEQNLAEEVRVGLNTKDTEERVRKVVADLMVDIPSWDIHDEMNFEDDLGADEESLVDIIKGLEKEFDTVIPYPWPKKITTVQRAIDYMYNVATLYEGNKNHRHMNAHGMKYCAKTNCRAWWDKACDKCSRAESHQWDVQKNTNCNGKLRSCENLEDCKRTCLAWDKCYGIIYYNAYLGRDRTAWQYDAIDCRGESDNLVPPVVGSYDEGSTFYVKPSSPQTYDILGSSHNAIILFAIIGVFSLVYHAAKVVNKRFIYTAEFTRIEDDVQAEC